MRFIVDAYRIIILAVLALGLIIGSYLVFSAFLAGDGIIGGATLLWFLWIAIVVILILGFLAVIISTHDRIAEISEQSRRIADALDQLQAKPS